MPTDLTLQRLSSGSADATASAVRAGPAGTGVGQAAISQGGQSQAGPLPTDMPQASAILAGGAAAAAAGVADVAPSPDPSVALNPVLGLVVITFHDAAGTVTNTIPSERQLAAYQHWSRVHAGPPAPGMLPADAASHAVGATGGAGGAALGTETGGGKPQGGDAGSGGSAGRNPRAEHASAGGHDPPTTPSPPITREA